ncbi:MAG: two pore domain potassium channel family protein [Acidobacteria bacterium]|nr:two pore domain potassium channel family protein [Acidobacteriota bacterium]
MPDSPGKPGLPRTRHMASLGRLTVLLLALAALLVVPPLVSFSTTGEAVFNLIFSLIAVGAALEIGHGKALLVIAGSVAAAAVATQAVSMIWPRATVGQAASEFFIAVLFGLLIWKVGRDVLRAKVVTTDVLRGTVAIYLMLGLSWAMLYRVTDSLDASAFAGPTAIRAESPQRGASSALRHNEGFRYYSFVTLTTLGYGDITPRSKPARTLSWLEAVVGQLFIAIAVARLVALHVALDRRGDDS